MENIDGLIYAYLLDKKGGAKKISLQEYENRKADDIIWLHFDYTNENSVNWLENNSGLDEIVTTALLTPETRPRTVFLDDSILIALRGINFNVNAQPEDMVSLRVFINENQIITTKKRDMLSVAEIAQELELKKGVKNSSEFLITLVDKITSKMQETIDELEESSLDLEENVLSDESASIKTKISSFRKELLSLKRYLYPQKDALNKLVFNSISWLTDYDKIKLKEVTDHLIRYIEEIETLKDKLSLIQEEFTNKISEQMNQRVYILSIVSAIFLPLGFFTGLFGINIGGMPGVENKDAFNLFLVALVVLLVVQLFIFKKKKWI
ncbi:zinc transporter ZntB [Arcobacter sp. YIC-464]|uniref:zinc transporter ZntB n=1 Tax=Arcobacter sp. YIC-464 TaxID=3376631 RepID=UPI003C177DFB